MRLKGKGEAWRCLEHQSVRPDGGLSGGTPRPPIVRPRLAAFHPPASVRHINLVSSIHISVALAYEFSEMSRDAQIAIRLQATAAAFMRQHGLDALEELGSLLFDSIRPLLDEHGFSAPAQRVPERPLHQAPHYLDAAFLRPPMAPDYNAPTVDSRYDQPTRGNPAFASGQLSSPRPFAHRDEQPRARPRLTLVAAAKDPPD
jgi:hypothetical protein